MQVRFVIWRNFVILITGGEEFSEYVVLTSNVYVIQVSTVVVGVGGGGEIFFLKMDQNKTKQKSVNI